MGEYFIFKQQTCSKEEYKKHIERMIRWGEDEKERMVKRNLKAIAKREASTNIWKQKLEELNN